MIVKFFFYEKACSLVPGVLEHVVIGEVIQTIRPATWACQKTPHINSEIYYFIKTT